MYYFQFPGPGGGKKKHFKGQKKNKSKSKSSQYKKTKKSGGIGGSGNELTDKILAAMEKHKEVINISLNFFYPPSDVKSVVLRFFSSYG